MPRRNHSKGRRPQAQRGKFTPPAMTQEVHENWFTPRVNGLPQRKKRPTLLPMVPSTGSCPTGKIRYGTAADAAEALRRAIVNREALQSEVREERYYPMPGDAPCVCEGFHLTHTKRRAK